MQGFRTILFLHPLPRRMHAREHARRGGGRVAMSCIRSVIHEDLLEDRKRTVSHTVLYRYLFLPSSTLLRFRLEISMGDRLSLCRLRASAACTTSIVGIASTATRATRACSWLGARITSIERRSEGVGRLEELPWPPHARPCLADREGGAPGRRRSRRARDGRGRCQHHVRCLAAWRRYWEAEIRPKRPGRSTSRAWSKSTPWKRPSSSWTTNNSVERRKCCAKNAWQKAWMPCSWKRSQSQEKDPGVRWDCDRSTCNWWVE